MHSSYRKSLLRDLQEGSYCAQFKTYHDEMKENEDEEPTVTEAELARVTELAEWMKSGVMTKQLAANYELGILCPRLARELAAARAAIKVARKILTKAKKDSEHAFSPSAILEAFSATLTQLNNHYE